MSEDSRAVRRLCLICNGSGVEPLIETSLETLKRSLANQRIKYGCDYAITHKYEEYHLLCHAVWTDTIKKIAQSLGISFNSTSTYL